MSMRTYCVDGEGATRALTNMATYTVQLHFEPPADWDQARLEDAAVDVSEVLEGKTPETVSGAAVSLVFEPAAIEVDLVIQAESDAEQHRILASVVQLLEGATAELGKSGYAEHSRREPVLAA
jgi:hypothetical protein